MVQSIALATEHDFSIQNYCKRAPQKLSLGFSDVTGLFFFTFVGAGCHKLCRGTLSVRQMVGEMSS